MNDNHKEMHEGVDILAGLSDVCGSLVGLVIIIIF